MDNASPAGHAWSFNAFYPSRLQAHAGDTVAFRLAPNPDAFHHVTLMPAGTVPAQGYPGFMFPDPYVPGGAQTTFFSNGPNFSQRPETPCGRAGQPACTYDGAGALNSGVLVNPPASGGGTGHRAFTVQLDGGLTPGSYFYLCLVHGPGMRGRHRRPSGSRAGAGQGRAARGRPARLRVRPGRRRRRRPGHRSPHRGDQPGRHQDVGPGRRRRRAGRPPLGQRVRRPGPAGQGRRYGDLDDAGAGGRGARRDRLRRGRGRSAQPATGVRAGLPAPAPGHRHGSDARERHGRGRAGRPRGGAGRGARGEPRGAGQRRRRPGSSRGRQRAASPSTSGTAAPAGRWPCSRCTASPRPPPGRPPPARTSPPAC